MTIQEMLDKLSELQASRTVVNLQKQELIDAVLTAEIKAKLDEIEAEFSPTFEAIDAGISALESEVKAAVIQAGATVKGAHLQAVYTKGRVSWDTKGLDGYLVAHPEMAAFRKEGAPSVTIRS